MLTRFSLLPSAGGATSGILVIAPGKVHDVYGGTRRSSGWSMGIHSPPPIGKPLFLVSSIRNRSFMSASFAGILPARSLACDQSLLRSESSHLGLSGVHSWMPWGKPGTHGTRGPNADAIHP